MHPDWLQQESRTEGMKQVLLKLVREAEARGETVVLMGDMNDDPDVPRPKWARDSAAYPWGGSILAAKDVLNDAYEISETTPMGPKNSAHGFEPVGTSRLDHIFLTRGVRVESYRTHDDPRSHMLTMKPPIHPRTFCFRQSDIDMCIRF